MLSRLNTYTHWYYLTQHGLSISSFQHTMHFRIYIYRWWTVPLREQSLQTILSTLQSSMASVVLTWTGSIRQTKQVTISVCLTSKYRSVLDSLYMQYEMNCTHMWKNIFEKIGFFFVKIKFHMWLFISTSGCLHRTAEAPAIEVRFKWTYFVSSSVSRIWHHWCFLQCSSTWPVSPDSMCRPDTKEMVWLEAYHNLNQ